MGRREAARPAALRPRPADRGQRPRGPHRRARPRAGSPGTGASAPTSGSPTSGSARTACPGSRSPSTSPTRAWRGSSCTQMLEVEGGTREWCLRILRHEAGHAIENAYRLRQRPRRQELFGRTLGALPRLLRAQALQPQLRPPPRRLVRPEPSRRGLRRDLRRVAHARLGLGARATRAGPPCASSSTWTRSCAELAGRAAAGDRRAARPRPLASLRRTLRGHYQRSAATTAWSSATPTTATCGGSSRSPRARGHPARGPLPVADPPRRAPARPALDRGVPVR